MYMGNLSEVFFFNIVETMKAYTKSFTTNVGGAAGQLLLLDRECHAQPLLIDPVDYFYFAETKILGAF